MIIKQQNANLKPIIVSIDFDWRNSCPIEKGWTRSEDLIKENEEANK
jgi:hypothetical protein